MSERSFSGTMGIGADVLLAHLSDLIADERDDRLHAFTGEYVDVLDWEVTLPDIEVKFRVIYDDPS